jgi:uncharacterized NAD-dependent epimerase/dehydratase family protein
MLQLSQHRVAVLLHEGVQGTKGKTGLAVIRHYPEAIVAIIDQQINEQCPGESFSNVTGIACNAPIVSSLAESLAYKPDVLLIGIAPSGGVLPEAWLQEVKQAVAAGLAIVNGLHTQLSVHPEITEVLRESKMPPLIWDIRQEPPGLSVGTGAARSLQCKRVLTVGTDMSVGKMSASLALDAICRSQGMRSKFLGTGQAGIMIAGEGVALDAVRVDFASGAVEQLVMAQKKSYEILHIEGQGSLLNPASTATLPLLRGSQPTHLVLVHRAGQMQIRNYPEVPIPPLSKVVALYEAIAAAAGSFFPAPVVGIALNTAHLDNYAARDAIKSVADETGLPCADLLRFPAESLLRFD